jgi:hypothetical protein
METEKSNNEETKTNSEVQSTMVEMGEVNHCSRPSTTVENKPSG